MKLNYTSLVVRSFLLLNLLLNVLLLLSFTEVFAGDLELQKSCRETLETPMCQKIAKQDLLDCSTVVETTTQKDNKSFDPLTACHDSIVKLSDELKMMSESVGQQIYSAHQNRVNRSLLKSSELANSFTSNVIAQEGIKAAIHSAFYWWLYYSDLVDGAKTAGINGAVAINKGYINRLEEAEGSYHKALFNTFSQIAKTIYQEAEEVIDKGVCMNSRARQRRACSFAAGGTLAALGPAVYLSKKALRKTIVPNDLTRTFLDFEGWNDLEMEKIKNIGPGINAKLSLGPTTIGAYLQSEKAKKTVEVLWFPDSFGSPKGTGHLGIRIDDKVHHISRNGVNVDDFVDYSLERFSKGMAFFGYAFEASNTDKLAIIKAFSGKKFHKAFSNCSQNVCQALNSAGIVNVNKIISSDPLLAKNSISQLDRKGYKTVYSEKDDALGAVELTRENVTARAAGVAIAGGSVGVSIFGLSEAWLLIKSLITTGEEQ